ncbi:ATP-binding cassette domain-containing protein [Virgibacillus sp. W0181]|uniref:ATP-binding cassette domain-containing protein n=1 Tax=Virgibacillus sp. W0181 TaxID=3391581 RepID=UPI003F45A635
MLTVNISKKMPHFTLDVRFHAGDEIIALVGPSGSGKTTILNSIAGLTALDQGNIQLNDSVFVKNAKSLVPVQKRNIGYLFQDYALFPHKTVWGNVSYGMRNQKLGERIVHELRIENLIKKYPHEISGGEKQRVALARALATEPRLLLLDEPFSALDDITRMKAHEELLYLRKRWGIPILLVTHNIEEANKLADRIIYVQDGKLVTSAELKENTQTPSRL